MRKYSAVSLSLLLLSACIPLDLDTLPTSPQLGSSATVPSAMVSPSPRPAQEPSVSPTSPSPVATASPLPGNSPETPFTTLPTDSVQPLTAGQLLPEEQNLARRAGVQIEASSEFRGWPKERLNDGNLNTSWFAAAGDSTTQGKTPWVAYRFPQSVRVTGVNIWGNREYQNGYDVLEATLTLERGNGQRQSYRFSLPEPNRDFSIRFPQAVTDVVSLRLEVVHDEKDPGISELEVVGELESESALPTSTVIAEPLLEQALMSESANLARQSGVQIEASSEFRGWPKERLNDGNLNTSWFAAAGDSTTQGKIPWVAYRFPRPVRVTGVNIWGNREYRNGYNVLDATLILERSNGQRQSYRFSLPEPNRDFSIRFPQAVTDVVSLRLEVMRDEKDPGISELEVSGSPD